MGRNFRKKVSFENMRRKKIKEDELNYIKKLARLYMEETRYKLEKVSVDVGPLRKICKWVLKQKGVVNMVSEKELVKTTIEEGSNKNEFSIAQIGNEFMATRYQVETFTPERIIAVVDSLDKRIVQAGTQAEAYMNEVKNLQDARKDWDAAYEKAKIIIASRLPVAVEEKP